MKWTLQGPNFREVKLFQKFELLERCHAQGAQPHRVAAARVLPTVPHQLDEHQRYRCRRYRRQQIFDFDFPSLCEGAHTTGGAGFRA
jgi:hypothetical protein